MRFWGLCAALLALGGIVMAQAPAPRADGNLNQVMRGILFPNSNLLFDVQSNDPETFGKRGSGGGASASYGGVYTGWMIVENAAVALAEATTLITVPGRMCENGKPVPVNNDDYKKFAEGLRTAALEMLAAARKKDRDAATMATDTVATACFDCHDKYRDVTDRCGA